MRIRASVLPRLGGGFVWEYLRSALGSMFQFQHCPHVTLHGETYGTEHKLTAHAKSWVCKITLKLPDMDLLEAAIRIPSGSCSLNTHPKQQQL